MKSWRTRQDKHADDSTRLNEIRAAIQDLVRKGLVMDSGQRRWSQRTASYEIVWKLTDVGKTLGKTDLQNH
jgi:predicted metal-dependent enzyme (double-stranded beta helix superfamily)